MAETGGHSSNPFNKYFLRGSTLSPPGQGIGENKKKKLVAGDETMGGRGRERMGIECCHVNRCGV